MPKKPKHPVATPTPEPVVDHRAPDQDGAVEVAFVEGTLPEHDRRAPEPVAPPKPKGPVFAADAGAVFQKDRAGDPRGRDVSEGAANFAAFSQSIRDAAKPEETE